MAREPGRRSVRARITAAAVAVVGAALTLAGVGLVLLVQRSLERPMRGEARARAADVLVQPIGPTWPQPLRPVAAPWPTLVQVLDASGAVLAAHAELAGRAPLLAPTAADREPSDETTLTANGRTQRWRLDAVRADWRGVPVTVVVATSLAQVDRSTRLVTTAMLIAVPVLVLVAGLVAWQLVGRALAPVDALRREVAGFDGSGVRRVTPPASDDEIGQLAGTINGLLGRVDVAREQQHRFVADASHELRTPVANIRAALEVATAHPDAVAWPAVAADVLEQNERMGHLVDDLLLLAQAEADQLTARAVLVDAAVTADGVVTTLKARLAAEGRPVGVRWSHDGVTVVRADPSHLARIVENLTANAARFARSTVAVHVGRIGRWVEVTVADDGPGVPEAERGRVFERFVRLDTDRSRRGGGAGLGLPIVAELVARAGGLVSVGDGGPGAVFTVRLPAASPGADGGVTGPAGAAPVSASS